MKKLGRTKVHKHCPLRASQSLIVLSLDPVSTKDIPSESTLADCTFAGCIIGSDKR